MLKDVGNDSKQLIETLQLQISQVILMLKTHTQLLEEQSRVLSQHTGTLAEVLVTVKRLDEERLVEHHRLNQVIQDVDRVKEALSLQ